MSPENVKQIRERMGLTRDEFAGELGVNPKTIARWERGEVIVPEYQARHIKLMAEKVGVA